MLASMSETDPLADTPLNWSDLGVSELPTGTVTLLLADVEGSTRLWETQGDDGRHRAPGSHGVRHRRRP